MSLPTWLFICCDSDLFVHGIHREMSNSGGNSINDLLRELLATVNTLKKDVDEYKA